MCVRSLLHHCQCMKPSVLTLFNSIQTDPQLNDQTTHLLTSEYSMKEKFSKQLRQTHTTYKTTYCLNEIVSLNATHQINRAMAKLQATS